MILGVVGALLAVAPPSSGEDLVFGTVHGTVTGPDGEPIRGAHVRSYYRGPEGWDGGLHGAVTDADGNYTLLHNLGEPFRLEILAEGHVSEFWNNAATVGAARDLRLTSAQPTRSGVDARLDRLGSVAGTVVDRDGAPVAGAYLGVYDDRHELVGSSPPTGPEGRFKISDLPPGVYRLQVRIIEKREVVSEWFHDREDFASATPITVRSGESVVGIVAELDPPGSIAGTVRLASGLPAEESTNVIAVARADGDWYTAGESYTRADGSYEIEGLPAGDYLVGVPGDNVYQTEYYPGVADHLQATKVHVVAGDVVGGIALVRHRFGQISGRVRSDKGAPLAGVDVHLFTKTGSTWPTVPSAAARTDATGAYLLDGVSQGTHRVLFGNPGDPYLREFWSNASTFNGAAEIGLGRSERRAGVDAGLAPASAITGRVTNQAGTPLSAISVTAFVKTATGYRLAASTMTRSNGGYRLGGLDPARHRLDFRDTRSGVVYHLREYWNERGGASSLSGAADIAVPRSGTKSGVNARLVRGATVSGRVVDKSRWPFLGVRVHRYEAGRWRTQTTSTVLPDGRFSLRLEAGRYRLGFMGVNGNLLEYWDDATKFNRARDIVLKPGSNVTGVNAVTTSAVPSDVGLDRMPGLRGRAFVGETVKVEDVFVVPEDAIVRYQWYLDDQPVRGETTPSLRIQQNMVGRRVSVVVTASKAGMTPLRMLMLAEVARPA